jgi:hypothetical protein
MTNRTDHIGRGCLPLLPIKRMALCEANGVDFLFGRAKNERLIAEISTELDVVAAKSPPSKASHSPRRATPPRRFLALA